MPTNTSNTESIHSASKLELECRKLEAEIAAIEAENKSKSEPVALLPYIRSQLRRNLLGWTLTVLASLVTCLLPVLSEQIRTSLNRANDRFATYETISDRLGAVVFACGVMNRDLDHFHVFTDDNKRAFSATLTKWKNHTYSDQAKLRLLWGESTLALYHPFDKRLDEYRDLLREIEERQDKAKTKAQEYTDDEMIAHLARLRDTLTALERAASELSDALTKSL